MIRLVRSAAFWTAASAAVLSASPARAEETCPAARAGAAVTSLWHEPLGVLATTTPADDCDTSYLLVPWDDSVGIVARPGALASSGSVHHDTPDCTDESTSTACGVRRAILSKLAEWRRDHPRASRRK